MFYYAGHGSQEQAPEAFWHLEPDRLIEHLVCYDSRSPGGWGLADKELRMLIDELAARVGHLAVILDCCHSGSGTRGELADDVVVRMSPADSRVRPLDAFLPGVLENLNSAASLASPSRQGRDGSSPGRHVCWRLAATMRRRKSTGTVERSLTSSWRL